MLLGNRKVEPQSPSWLSLVMLLVAIAVTAAAATFSPAMASDENKASGDDAASTPAVIHPLDLLDIQVVGTLLNQPIAGVFFVEPSGRGFAGPCLWPGQR